MICHSSDRYNAPRPVIWIEDANAASCQRLKDAFTDQIVKLECFASLNSWPKDCGRPDLLICGDSVLPETAISRAARPELEDVPLLLLTSKPDDRLRELCASKLTDFVVQPFSSAELSLRATNLLAASNNGSASKGVTSTASTARLHEVIAEDDHWRLMVESIDDYAIFMVDADGKVRTWNRGAEELTGYSVEQAVGRSFSSFYTSQGRQPTELQQELERASQVGRYENEAVHKRRDGSTYHAQVTVQRIDNGSGVLVGYVMVIRDITPRKQAEMALKESEAKFRTIADAMPQMVWSTRPDGYHDYYNQQWYDYTGMPEGSTDGDGWNPMFHPDDQARAWHLWGHSLATGDRYEIEYRVRHHSGEYRWTLGRALPIRDDDGKIVRWMGTCTEIHAQKQAEAALQEASHLKDEFLAMLAHELRNPLGPLHNSMVLMRQTESLSRPVEAALDVAERQVWHMSRLINDLVDVARISRRKMHLRKEHCDLNEIVQQAAEDLRTVFEDRGIDLQIHCLNESLGIHGDRTRIAQVIGNLLHNASKFTQPGGSVRVSTSRRALPGGERAEVIVQDSGVGIEPELATYLFDPFVQADQDLSRADGGLGLGLAVVKGLMELHDGSVEAHSEGAGKGTTFTLEFPLYAGTLPAKTGRQSALETVNTERWRIVLVEDNKDMLETLATLLRSEGHEVVTAHDGPSGLVAVNSEQPDLVICDIGLPGAMNGYALARAIRASQDADLSQVFLIALSGYSQDSDRQKSRESGFDLHLLKPLDFAELRKLLATTKIK